MRALCGICAVRRKVERRAAARGRPPPGSGVDPLRGVYYKRAMQCTGSRVTDGGRRRWMATPRVARKLTRELTRRVTPRAVPALVFALVLAGALAVAPVHGHISYMPGDAAVEHLAQLYAEAGMVFPVASFPVAKRDLVRYAIRLETARPGMTGAVAAFLEDLDFRPGEATVNADLDFELDAYLRSEDARWINEELDHDSYDFHRRYLSMPEFVALSLYSERDDQGGMFINAGVRRRYERGEFLDTNFLEFHPDRIIRADNYFIRQGYLYHYFGDLEVLLGRNKLHLGAPDFSSFMASDRLPHLDALTLRYRLGPIHMTSVSATLENRRAVGERDLDEDWNGDGNGDTADPFGMAGNGHPMPNTEGTWPEDRLGWGQTIIYYGVHRFDYIRERLRLGIAAQQFVARENNALHLGDTFPVFSWHNTDVGPHNMSLIMDLSWAPKPGLEVNLQAGYNDINADKLLGIPDADIPTIDAYLAGVSYRGPVGRRRFRGAAEVGYTHFLWGNFYDYNADKGNYLARGVYRFRTHGIYMLPMTAPYGPGVTWTRWRGELGGFPAGSDSEAGEFVFGLDAELLSRLDREVVNLVHTVYDPVDGDYSLYEDADTELLWRVAPRVTYRHPRFGSYFVEPALHGWEDHTWVEVTLGGSISYAWRGGFGE